MRKYIYIIACVCVLTACAGVRKTTETSNERVIVQTVRDTVIMREVQRDSVAVYDSVFIQLSGDTVYYTKYRDRLIYRNIGTSEERAAVRTDTVYITKTHTEKVKEPQRKVWVIDFFIIVVLLMLCYTRRRA